MSFGHNSQTYYTIFGHIITPAFKKAYLPLYQKNLKPDDPLLDDDKKDKKDKKNHKSMTYGSYLTDRVMNDMGMEQERTYAPNGQPRWGIKRCSEKDVFRRSPRPPVALPPWGHETLVSVDKREDPKESYLTSFIADLIDDFHKEIFTQQAKGHLLDNAIKVLARQTLLFILMHWLIRLQYDLRNSNLNSNGRSFYNHLIKVLKEFVHGKNSLFYVDDLQGVTHEKGPNYFIFEAKDSVTHFLQPLIKTWIQPFKTDTTASEPKIAWQCILEFIAKQPIITTDYLTSFPDDKEFFSSENTQSAWVELFHRLAHTELATTKQKSEKDMKDESKPVSPLENFYIKLKEVKGDEYAGFALNNAIAHLRKATDQNPPFRAAEVDARKHTLYRLIFLSKTATPTNGIDKRRGEFFLKQKINNCTTVAEVLEIFDAYVEHPMVKNHRWGGNFFPNSKINFINACRAKFNALNITEKSDIDVARLFEQDEGQMRQRSIRKVL